MYAWQLAPPSSRERPPLCPDAWRVVRTPGTKSRTPSSTRTQQAAAPPPPPAEDDATTQLQNLANLHAQGVLTDEEFAASKAKILGI